MYSRYIYKCLIMTRKSIWTTEELENLTKLENHKIMFDGYEFYWVSKIKDTIRFEIQDNIWGMIRKDYKSFMTNKLTLEDILD